MIMHLTYEFEKDGKVYNAVGIDIGETCDIEAEAKDTEGLKIAAICHALNLTIDEIEENNININDYEFKYCELDA